MAGPTGAWSLGQKFGAERGGRAIAERQVGADGPFLLNQRISKLVPVEAFDRAMLDAAVIFCTAHGVNIRAMQELPLGSLQRLEHMDAAINALISPDPLRREFLSHERLVGTLYRAVKPDPVALEFLGQVACLLALSDAIRATLNPEPVDVSMVMEDKGASANRNRGCARPRFARRLHAAVVSAKMRGAVRTCL